MSRPLLDLNYDGNVPDSWHIPMHWIPDPETETTIRQTEYFYKICQLLLDAGLLTKCRTIYALALVELITSFPDHPTSEDCEKYIQLSGSFCLKLGLDQEDIQKAAVPIWY